MIPNYESDKVQEIIDDIDLSMREKAKKIIQYSELVIEMGHGSKDTTWKKKIANLPTVNELIKELEG